jgi:hypothetical protein
MLTVLIAYELITLLLSTIYYSMVSLFLGLVTDGISNNQDNKHSIPKQAGSNTSHQCLNKITTSLQHNPRTLACLSNSENIVHGQCESDSHARTFVAGPNCVILEYATQSVDFSAYSKEYEEIATFPLLLLLQNKMTPRQISPTSSSWAKPYTWAISLIVHSYVPTC